MAREQLPVSIALLGGVAVRYQGDPVRPPSSRAIELLAYLTAHADSSHSRQHLAALLWPDSTEAQARTNLRRELHNLRSLIRDDSCLDVTATSLAWRDNGRCNVDIRTFLVGVDAVAAARRARDDEAVVAAGRTALAAYGGPLLPGVYDDWVLETRDALLRRCLNVCDELSVLLAEDDLPGALDVARRRIQLEPLEEVGYRQLMDLQLAAGDRAGAMTTYHRCASMLEEQLGVTPTAETSAALRRVIGLPSGPDPDTLPAATRTAATSKARQLVGRDNDLDTLRAH
jgi:DNA-binding SARP family transcriptional activator